MLDKIFYVTLVFLNATLLFTLYNIIKLYLMIYKQKKHVNENNINLELSNDYKKFLKYVINKKHMGDYIFLTGCIFFLISIGEFLFCSAAILITGVIIFRKQTQKEMTELLNLSK